MANYRFRFCNLDTLKEFGTGLIDTVANNGLRAGSQFMRFLNFVASLFKSGAFSVANWTIPILKEFAQTCAEWIGSKALFGIKTFFANDVVYAIIVFALIFLTLSRMIGLVTLMVALGLLSLIANNWLKACSIIMIGALKFYQEYAYQNHVVVHVTNHVHQARVHQGGILSLIHNSSILFMVALGVWFLPKDRDFNGLIQQLDKVPKAMDGLKTLGDRFEFSLKWAQKHLGISALGYDLQEPIPDEVRQNYDEVMDYCDRLIISELGTDPTQCDRVQDVYHTYMRLRRSYHDNRNIINFMDQYQGAVVNLWQKVINTNPQLAHRRVRPTSVFFRGDTGVGKSNLLYFLATDVLIKHGMIDATMSNDGILKLINSSLWPRNPEQDHNDGYGKQIMALLDDAGQMKDSTGNPNKEYLEWIRMINDFPYMLKMAELSQKSNTYFVSKYVFATTNLKRIDPVSIVDASAVRSRIDYGFEVYIEPEVMIDADSTDAALRKIDPTKVIERYGTVFTNKIYRFRSWDTLTGATDNSEFTYEEVWKMISDKQDKHTWEHEQSQGVLLNHARQRFAESNLVQQAFEEDDPRAAIPTMTATQSRLLITQQAMETGLFAMADRYNQFAQSEHVRALQEGVMEQIRANVRESLDRLVVLHEPWYKRFWKSERKIEQCEVLLSQIRSKLAYEKIKNDVLALVQNANVRKIFMAVTIVAAAFLAMFAAYRFIKSGKGPREIRDTNLRFLLCNKPGALLRMRKDPYLMKQAYERYGDTIMQEIASLCDYYGEVSSNLFMIDEPIVWPKEDKDYDAEITVSILDQTVTVYGDEFVLKKIRELAHILSEREPSNDFPFQMEARASVRVRNFALNHKHGVMYDMDRVHVTGDVEEQIPGWPNILMESGKDPRTVVRKMESGKDPRLSVKLMESGKDPRTIAKVMESDPQVERVKSGEPIFTCEAYRSQQSLEVTDVVRKNYAALHTPDGELICPVLFIRGRWGLINYHYFMGVMQKFECYKLVGVGMNTGYDITRQYMAENGYQLQRAGASTDIFVIEFPKSIPLYRDIAKNFLSCHDADKIVDKTCVMVVPYQNTFVYKTGTVKELIAEPVTTDFTTWKSRIYRIDVRTQYGDCGGCYVVDTDSVRGRIFAFHSIGDQNKGGAMAFPLFKEDFEGIKCVSLVCPDIQIDTPEQFQGVCQQGRILKPVHSALKSAIGKTPFFNKIFESVSAPAKLQPMMTTDGPAFKQLKKVVGDIPLLDGEICEYAYQDYKSVAFSAGPIDMARELTFEEAVVGIADDPCIRGINKTTSAGYPWSQVWKGGKRHWFGEDEFILNSEQADQVRKTCEEWHKCVDAGMYVPSIYVNTLKDETRPLEKVLAGKTRLFAAAPMHYVILFRMYFLTFLRFMMVNRIDNECTVGIRCQSPEWHRLAMKLQSKGKKVVAGDFENYDGTLHPDILNLAKRLIDDFFGGKDSPYRDALWEDVIHSWHIFHDVVLRWTKSQPSGNPGTAVINSIYNSLVIRYAYYWLAKKLTIKNVPDFHKVCYVASYGDDDVINIADGVIEWFNQDSITWALAEIGMTYTAEDKTSAVAPYRSLDEIRFLKRGFRFEPMISLYVAPLTEASIFERLNWIKRPDKVTKETYIETFKQVVFECALHGEDFYNEWVDRLNQGLQGFHCFPKYPRMRYLELVAGDNVYDLFPDLVYA